MNFGSSNLNEETVSSTGSVKVTWTQAYSASGYLIKKQNATTGAWETYTKLAKSKKSYTFPVASGSVTEEYRIYAYSGSTTLSTGYISVSVDPSVAAPTGVKATANSTTGAITVSWNAVSGASYYTVYRTTSASSVYDTASKKYVYTFEGDKVPVYTANAAALSGYSTEGYTTTLTSLVDQTISYTYNGVTNTLYEGPQAGVKYYYYVVAYKAGTIYTNSYIASANSAAASATITTTTVSKPTLKSASASTGKVTVKWKKVSGAAGYEIYRSTKKGSGYTLVGVVTKGSTVTYTDKTTTAGTTYYYKVRAYKLNEAGAYKYSSYSAKKKVTAK